MTEQKQADLANFTKQGKEQLNQGKTDEAVKSFEQAVGIIAILD